MEFDGQVWFTFGSGDVWHFYRFVLAFARAGNRVALEWSPLDDGAESDAMAVFLGLPDAEARGRYLHAMLGSIHIDGRQPGDPATIEAACEAAGIPWSPPSEASRASLAELRARADALGVTAAPTLYRHGPLLHIVVNAAAATGDLTATARTILGAADDDGIWRLAKP